MATIVIPPIIELDDFFSLSSTPVQRVYHRASPPAPIKSHYRPFSTLYTESPYIEIPNKEVRHLRRTASVSSGFQAMGLHFKDKSKSFTVSPKESDLEKAALKGSVQAKIKPRPRPIIISDAQHSATLTSTRPPVPRMRVNKKMSISTLFNSISDAAVPASVTSESPSHSPVSLDTTPLKQDDSFKSPSGRIISFKEANDENNRVPAFVPKTGFSNRRTMKLHPYQGEVPYMQAYDPILLENDHYTDLLLQRLSNGSPSFYTYGKKCPATALDLGCGAGHWVLFAANIWKETQFIGFDLVDVTHPAFKGTENVKFVQGNFLDFQLPFPNNFFEYVRMANLVLCIPSSRWQTVLAEVYRVLTPGGRLELIDDEMFFPYGEVPKEPERHHFSRPPALKGNDDTLEEDTDATLIDEGGSSPSSFEEKSFEKSYLTESETIRPAIGFLPANRTFQVYSKPVASKKKDPLVDEFSLLESRQSAWQRRASASRHLEAIYETMLMNNFSVLPRPSEFILDVLMGVFGKNNAGKTQSFHVKLAPTDSHTGNGWKRTESGEKDENTNISNSELGINSKKKWMAGKKKKESFSKGDTSSSENSSERSSLEIPIAVNLPAKAADRLGLTLPPDSTPSRAATPKISYPLSGPIIPVVSAKAAGRLGISYSALAAAIEKETVSHGRAADVKPGNPAQSPGLLVWPSTYIPMAPAELEMHACKHMHTLLGCQLALAAFVAKFVDDDGYMLIDKSAFSEAVWEYECFRRARFNWPSEFSDAYEDDLPSASTPPSPVASEHSLKPTKSGSHSRGSSSDSFTEKFQRDDLTHVRTIRVFIAVKANESSFMSMFSSKAMPFFEII